MRPPTLVTAQEAFAGATDRAERARLLVRELFEFYDRGRIFMEVVLREAHQVPALAEWMAGWESSRKEIVGEALQPEGADDSTVQMILALTDFRVWHSLVDQDVPVEKAVATVSEILSHLLAEPTTAKLEN